MALLRISLTLFFAGILGFAAGAQVAGGNPPSLKWKQVNTPAFRIIFPSGLDSTASRIANIITYIQGPTSETIGPRIKKIPIVLQNQTTVSNGYVSLGPFRSEFYMTPPQNSFDQGSTPWADQLAIHEYRHVQQYNNFNTGLSRFMHTVFGEEGQALANNAAIPNWFFEGDAVYNETNLSRQGRGALPSFYNPFRSLWMEGKDYSWMKLRNGSLKDFVPDHYALGFLLVAYGREKYGNGFWEKVTQDAAAFKPLFYPFQHALKKHAGISYTAFRKNAFDFFKTVFNIPEDTARKFISVTGKNKKQGSFRDEQYPVFTEDGNILFIRSTFTDVPRFVIRKQQSEHTVRVSDYTLDNYFSYRNGTIVYSVFKPDIRWGYRDYSNIALIKTATGKEYTITKKGKYFSPDISSDLKKIIAVYEAPSGSCSLHLLDAQTGKLIKRLPDTARLFYTYPVFLNEHTIITPVRNRSGKMSVLQVDLVNNDARYLLPFTDNVIGYPFCFRDTLYFSYSYKKNDELLAYTFSDKKLWLVSAESQEGLGKYHASVNDSLIAWSSFTAEGNHLQVFEKKQIRYTEINPDDLSRITSSFGITGINGKYANLVYSAPDSLFSIRPYKKSFHFFNFHSLEPGVNDPQYSLSLVGENILNTTATTLSFTYDRSEKFKQWSFSETFTGWFPYLSAGINYFIDRASLFHNHMIHYNQLEPYAGANIPLNLSKGRSFTYLNIGSQFVYSRATFRGAYKDTLGTPSYSYLSNFLSFTHQLQKAPQEIFPRLAQSLILTYKTAMTGGRAYQYTASGNFYFPSFLKTHSLVFNAAFLHKDSLNHLDFSGGFPFSRGYQAVNFFRMYKWGATYHLPLACPDVGLANVVYLLRVRAGFFYDDTEVKDFYPNQMPFRAGFRSAGTEITFDTKWWNQVGVSFGVRYSRLFDNDLYGNKGANRWEIILPVNILGN